MAKNGEHTIHKPAWISLNGAVDQWLQLLQAQIVYDTLSPEQSSLLNSTFSEALRVPEFSIKGVQLDGDASAPKGPLVEIPSLHFREYRTFRPHLNMIEPYHDAHQKDVGKFQTFRCM